MPPTVRLSVCLNAGPKKGAPAAALLVPLQTEAVLAAASNKLRLKKKEVARARLFVWRTGVELPRGGELEAGRVRNDDLIAISLGEPYAGPCKAEMKDGAVEDREDDKVQSAQQPIRPPSISGADDAGRNFGSLEELWREQAVHHLTYYEANAAWWDADGYGGSTDEEAMIGDGGSIEDLEHSVRFVDAVRVSHPGSLSHALDGGAGIGRVTKNVLLRRCDHVTLLEPCDRWLKQARCRHLGNKRAQRCTFASGRLEEWSPRPGTYDLIWIQWALQYLVDAHVISALRNLAAGLTKHGVLLLKENRPMAVGREASFQVCICAYGVHVYAYGVHVCMACICMHTYEHGVHVHAVPCMRHAMSYAWHAICMHGIYVHGTYTMPGMHMAWHAYGTVCIGHGMVCGMHGMGIWHAWHGMHGIVCGMHMACIWQVDVPDGPNGRYDITRPDDHHRWLFR